MESSDNQVFVSLLDYLKEEHGITNLFACDRIGVNKSKLANIRRGNSSVSRAHISALVTAFPAQLIEKATEIGLISKDAATTRTEQSLSDFSSRLDEIKNEILSFKEGSKELVDKIIKENEALRKTVGQLIDIIQSQK